MPSATHAAVTREALDAIDRFNEAFNRHDVNAVMSAMTNRDGAPGHIRGVDVFRIRDGLVAEKLSYVKG